MGNRLYVGNLNFKTDEEGLKSFFAQNGAVVSARIITDKETGRSRGFGFVEMETDDEASNTIEQLDGQELDGRPLRINFARERQPR